MFGAGQLMLQCGSGVMLDALRLVVGDACQALAILDSLGRYAPPV
jgi:hypothetical protein